MIDHGTLWQRGKKIKKSHLQWTDKIFQCYSLSLSCFSLPYKFTTHAKWPTHKNNKTLIFNRIGTYEEKNHHNHVFFRGKKERKEASSLLFWLTMAKFGQCRLRNTQLDCLLVRTVPRIFTTGGHEAGDWWQDTYHRKQFVSNLLG